MYKVAILIPAYYNVFSPTEKCAVQQCLKILSRYPVFFIVPNNLKIENDLIWENVEYIRVPEQWMDSIDSYNKMLCNVAFYEKFAEFEYVLIHQLDAFVFADRLQEFCDAGYDYYGAPWLYGVLNGKKRLYVGNGGLSLRRTQAMIKLLETEHYDCGYEDVFFGERKTDFYKVAPIDVALRFAFETEVRRCYLMNGKQLPFGCHAWEKWDYSFWKAFIEREGYHLEGVKETCEIAFKQWTGWDLSGRMLKGCIDLKEVSGGKIFVWGTKAEGFECGYFLQKIGITEFCYIDNDSKTWGDKLWGKRIISPSQLLEEGKNSVVIIAAKRFEKEIAAQIESVIEHIVYYSTVVKNIETSIQQIFFIGEMG